MDDANLGEAYAARRSGNPAAAVEICRRIIADDPAHHGARSLLAVCFAEAGHVDKARPLIEEAVAAEPDNWRFLLNLSVLREIEGRVDDAIRCAREAAANAPDRFEAWGRLGDLCGRHDDFEGAVAALEKAVALRPDDPRMALVLAAAAYETGRYDLADDALDEFDRFAPGRPDALRLRTHLARRRGDFDGFRDTARRWLAADPRSEEARVALAHGHAQRDDFHAAVETYRPLVNAHPQDAEHVATFAQYLLWSRDFEEAERLYRRALEVSPGHAAAAAGLARLKLFRGRFGEAAQFARTALAADPTNVDAYAQLALANDSQLPDEDLARLEIVATDAAIEPERRAIAWFTLGDVYHRRSDHDRAFDAWQRANELKHGAAAQSRYDRSATEKLVDRLIAHFGEFPDVSPTANAGPKPIFIVGMPRAGTTLLDSALASHPDISSGGELPGMPALLTRFLEWAVGSGWHGGAIPGVIADQFRAAYVGQYERYRIEPAAFVTDKQPLNFLSVGLIRHLFPDAPVIHIRRNALETGFSIYRNNFTKSWAFSTSLADIGHYYGQYARLMAHWNAVLGNAMATVQYEQLVGDFEGELRRLLAFAGLEWNSDCLSYFRQESMVTTLSSAQVRKPPSKELMRSTAPYVRALQPLSDALEEAGVES